MEGIRLYRKRENRYGVEVNRVCKKREDRYDVEGNRVCIRICYFVRRRTGMRLESKKGTLWRTGMGWSGIGYLFALLKMAGMGWRIIGCEKEGGDRYGMIFEK